MNFSSQQLSCRAIFTVNIAPIVVCFSNLCDYVCVYVCL